MFAPSGSDGLRTELAKRESLLGCKSWRQDCAKGAWSYPDPSARYAALKNHLAFAWHKMDHWYEEEEEVFVHPRDPYKRVDTMPSSRHVRVVINGETVAETRRPTLLFETGLPTRYYFPPKDVRMELLEPARGTTRCRTRGLLPTGRSRLAMNSSKTWFGATRTPFPNVPRSRACSVFTTRR